MNNLEERMTIDQLLRRILGFVRSLSRVSLRVKILVPVLAVILGSGGLLSWAVHGEVLEALSNQFYSRMEATVSELAYRVTQDVLVENDLGLRENLRRAVSLPDVVYVFVEDSRHDVAAHSFALGMPERLAEETRLPDSEQAGVVRLRTDQGLVLDYSQTLMPKELGVVHMGVTPVRIEEQSAKVTSQILWVTAFTAAASLCLIYFVTHILTQPIRDLTKSVRKVGDGDFSLRSAIQTGDEIGELANQFNVMTERLATWEGKLSDAQRLLLRSERLATVGKIASGVAHEIGNPLHAVLHLFKALESSPDKTGEYLPLIHEGLQRIQRVVHQLNGYARERRVQRQSTDIQEVIRDSIRLLEPQARQKGIRILFNPEPAAHILWGDRDALGQVVTNIVMNSLEAIPGPGTVTIQTFAAQSRDFLGAQIGISIEDDGPGIDPDALPKIFDPFFTTKEAGCGTGLGLAICQDIVNLHGGSIEAKSGKGRGTVFTIRLPVEPI